MIKNKVLYNQSVAKLITLNDQHSTFIFSYTLDTFSKYYEDFIQRFRIIQYNNKKKKKLPTIGQ